MEKIKKQYGLWTGIAMVIGIVIGSGVFVKADDVLKQSGGDLKLSLLAWLVGGLIMVASGFCFAVFATKVTKYNGVIDYVEVSTNKKVGYGLGWLISTFYYPIISSIVTLLAGNYFFSLLGLEVGMISWQNILFSVVVITAMTVMNYLSPMLSSKFQISTTIIKLIPIGVVAIIGLFAGLIVGGDAGILNAFKDSATGDANNTIVKNFGEAVKITAFAYEGWVCATAINAELKDSKRNLPKALVGGTIAVLVIYLIYYISLSSILGNQGTVVAGDNAPIQALSKILGSAGGVVFTVFIMISCLGTVNGLIISSCRGMYTLSCRGHGPAPEKFSKLGKNQSVSLYSTIYGYAFILIMLAVWCLAIKGVWIFRYLGGMDSTVCALIYGVYITMYVHMMVKFKDLDVFRRFVMPIIAILGSLFFIICGSGIYQIIFAKDISTFISFLVFMGLFVIFMFPCLFFYRKENEDKLQEETDAE